MNYFVSGGSRGIGAAIVLQAVREGHGVAFTYLRGAERAHEIVNQARAINPEVTCKAYQMDVRDSAAVETVGDQILDAFEDIHVVVNNAGINSDNLVASMSDEQWDDVIATNLNGPFYVVRTFLMSMLANRFGRIINISSVSAKGSAGQINYATAKAGLSGFTRTLAKEYGPKGITANIVVPGFFDTEMTQQTLSDSNREFWNKQCPLRRVGQLDEISKVVTFLGSDGAAFINGAEIPVTGGLDES